MNSWSEELLTTRTQESHQETTTQDKDSRKRTHKDSVKDKNAELKSILLSLTLVLILKSSLHLGTLLSLSNVLLNHNEPRMVCLNNFPAA